MNGELALLSRAGAFNIVDEHGVALGRLFRRELMLAGRKIVDGIERVDDAGCGEELRFGVAVLDVAVAEGAVSAVCGEAKRARRNLRAGLGAHDVVGSEEVGLAGEFSGVLVLFCGVSACTVNVLSSGDVMNEALRATDCGEVALGVGESPVDRVAGHCGRRCIVAERDVVDEMRKR